jgi:hypothetical protein
VTKKKLGDDNVFDPESGQIFVFGSNLAGIHGAGAALYARKHLGALQRVGEGLMGHSYALPTKDENIETLSLKSIEQHVCTFLRFARSAPEETFFVTRIGCGLAGFTDEQIAPHFADAPPNCILPPGWRAFNGEEE